MPDPNKLNRFRKWLSNVIDPGTLKKIQKETSKRKKDLTKVKVDKTKSNRKVKLKKDGTPDKRTKGNRKVDNLVNPVYKQDVTQPFWGEGRHTLNPISKKFWNQNINPASLLNYKITPNPFTNINEFVVKPAKWMYKNPVKTGLGAVGTYQVGSHFGWWGPGRENPYEIKQEILDQTGGGTTTFDNQQKKVNPNSDSFKLERRGGPVIGRRGRAVPGMKRGGSLKIGKDGRFYR